jgi:hypothetical protein
MNPQGSVFAVTMRYPGATIPRVAFHALGLLPGQVPIKVERLRTSLDICPSYDVCPMAIFSWSFGQGGKTYHKLELGYTGESGEMLRATNPFGQSG